MKHSIVRNVLCAGLLFSTLSAASQTVEWSRKANPSFLSVNSVAFRSDGNEVLSGTNCHPASIRLFDVNSGNLNWDYIVGTQYMCIMGVAFSANTDYLAAMEEFGNILIFDNTGPLPVLVDSLYTGSSYGFSTDISPASDEVVVGLSNGRIKAYSLPGAVPTRNVAAHTGWATTVSYSPDGLHIVSGGADNRVKIWSDSLTLEHTCLGHTGDITNVRVTPDNQYVVSSSKDNTIKVWNLQTGALVRTLAGHADDVMGVSISPDGSRVVSGCADGWCKIWDIDSGAALHTFGIPDSGSVNTVAWSPVGDRVVTGNAMSDVVLWNVPAVAVTPGQLGPAFEMGPNPAQDAVTVYLSSPEAGGEISITDMQGRLVYLQSLSPASGKLVLRLAELPDGIYTVTLRQGDHTGTRMLQVERP